MEYSYAMAVQRHYIFRNKSHTMKKLFAFCISVSLLFNTLAQRENEFQLRAGFGWGAFATTGEWSYTSGGITFTENDTDGAVAIHLPIELRYELHPRFNAGIDLKFGNYLYDPNDSTVQDNSNHFESFGFGLEGTLVRHENFRLYLGLNVNTTSLTLTDHIDWFGDTVTETQLWRGGGFQANIGFLAFFSKPIGFNFNLGYDSHTFKLKTFTRDGQAQDLTGWSGELKVRGVNGTLGLVVRI